MAALISVFTRNVPLTLTVGAVNVALALVAKPVWETPFS